jgi:hypothetical protein
VWLSRRGEEGLEEEKILQEMTRRGERRTDIS